MTMLTATIEGGGDYVAAAYTVFLLIVLIYVGIMSSKLVRIERKISDLAEKLGSGGSQSAANGENAPD